MVNTLKTKKSLHGEAILDIFALYIGRFPTQVSRPRRGLFRFEGFYLMPQSEATPSEPATL